jgi:DNA-binding transcriptional regulator YiaG
MPNVGAVIKQEISRVARRELRGEVELLRKTAREQRSQMAAFKRQLEAMQRTIKKLSSGGAARRAASSFEEGEGDADTSRRLRFSAKGLAAKRQKLGISAAQMARLIGVSQLSVYKWESGKARPRAAQIQRIAEVRALGKREVMQRLEILDAAQS